MKLTLIEMLRKETETLRVQYIEKTKEYAASSFAQLEKVAASPWPAYTDFATPGFVKSAERWCDYQQGINYRKATDAKNRAMNIMRAGYDVFEAREVKNAELHYENSIIKLALRIVKKGLDQTALTMGTSHIGVNIETTINDGTKTVRAWTIIASGPCVRPHYRYLIK
jgi:hypothetical protein